MAMWVMLGMHDVKSWGDVRDSWGALGATGLWPAIIIRPRQMCAYMSSVHGLGTGV